MNLPLSLSALTLTLGFLPTAWLWYARAWGRRGWLLTLTTAGGVVTFAYAAGPWLLVSYWLRYLALAAYGAVAVVCGWRRRRPRLAAYAEVPRAKVLFRAVVLAIVVALDGIAFAAGLAPDGAVELAFPLQHGTYSVLQGGNSFLSNPFHRTNPAERFAVDLVELNSWGARAKGLAPADLRAYVVFDDPVISPCQGSVAEVEDRVSDNRPGGVNVVTPAGNHIVLRCDDLDVLLAHLREGSVTVRLNEHVAAGQVVARVGNSGNTSEPHLHISATRSGRAVPLTFAGRFLSVNSVYEVRATPMKPAPR